MTWSVGEYLYGKEIWQGFKLQGQPPEPIGVFENQPAPSTVNLKTVWVAFIALSIFLLGLMAFTDMVASKDQVFTASYRLAPGPAKGEASFVTNVFELKAETLTSKSKP